MGTGGNFEEELDLFRIRTRNRLSVVAKGPAYGKGVVEMCIWIVQKAKAGERRGCGADNDDTGRAGLSRSNAPQETPGEPPEKYWKLRALQASKMPLAQGPAIAMAIALFLERQ